LRIASISVDLDPISCYYRIHALGEHPQALSDVLLRRSVPRYLEVLGQRGIRGTFFVVASDLDGGGLAARAARTLVTQLAAAGHEIANHSYSHPYELGRLGPLQVREEIGRAHGLIGDLVGAAPRGFRAPGYDLSPLLLDEIERLGYRYDSSLFPAPGYWLAKAGVMAALRVIGGKSGAVLTDPRGLWASPEPYRPRASAPWRKGQAALVELPVAVTPFLRIPAIGTSLLAGPAFLREHCLWAMRRRAFFNLELHGIDLVDAETDGIPSELVARQPDLRVPLERKQAAFEGILDRLGRDYRFLRLEDVAQQVGG
jgi:hypothetical protein